MARELATGADRVVVHPDDEPAGVLRRPAEVLLRDVGRLTGADRLAELREGLVPISDERHPGGQRLRPAGDEEVLGSA